MQRSKEDSFQKISTDGKDKFKCLVCDRLFSTKHSVMKHLSTAHFLSPVKRATKLYVDNPHIPVPQRTASRWKSRTTKPLFAKDEQPFHEQVAMQTKFTHQDAVLNEEPFETASDTECAMETVCDVDVMNEGTFSDESCDDGGDSSSISSSLSISESENSDNDISDSSASEAFDHSSITFQQKNFSPQEQQALKLLACFLRNNLSVNSCKDIISTLKELFPESASINSLNYDRLWKYVEDAKLTETHYCTLCCKQFPGNEDMFSCGTEGCEGLRYRGPVSAQTKKGRQSRNSFVFADLGTQLCGLLQLPGILKDIMDNKKQITSRQGGGTLSDITDAEGYQKLAENNGFLSESQFNLTAIFNTDGVNLYSSSRIELWPIFLAINELSPCYRFARDNMLLVGIWQGKGKPPFDLYMELFSSQVNKLYEEGVEVQANGQTVTVKLALTCGIFDLPAKAGVMNMTYFNGSQACVTCEEPGMVVSQGKGHARCYPYRAKDERPLKRDDYDVRRTMIEATEKKRKKGFKGQSGLVKLKEFDLVKGVVPDYMHGILLGIVKTLMYKWFSPTESKQPYFVGNKLREISARLQKIQPTENIERLPRDIEKHYGTLKATELQAWLLFYGIPCLEGILPFKYVNHFAQLSEAIFVLLGDEISNAKLQRAELLLDFFYADFNNLYSNGTCGLNVHNTSHLPDYVRQWGPLWAWSCFSFEDANAMLLQSVHGTGNVTKQIMRIRHARSLLRSINPVRDDDKWKKLTSTRNCSIGGALHPVDGSNVEDLQGLLQISDASVNVCDLKKAVRILIGGLRIYSEDYTRMKKRVCSVVLLQDGQVVSIKYFVLHTVTDTVYAVCGKFRVCTKPCPSPSVGGLHLLSVVKTEEKCFVSVDEIHERLLLINTGVSENCYVSKFPNALGRSVFK